MPGDWNDFLLKLYRENYDRMVRFAYRMCRVAGLAEDVVQETFILAICHQEELLTHPNPQAWLLKSLWNVTQNTNRRAHIHFELPLEDAGEAEAWTPVCGLDEILPMGLSDEDKQLLIWRYEEQLSNIEIAKRLHISEESARKKVFRARVCCKQRLLPPGE